METNEIEETTEAPVEETQEQVSEEVEEVADDTPTLEDYNELQKKFKTIEAQKEHWRKKAEEKKLEAPKAKEETPDVSDKYLTREEAILITKGTRPEVLEEAKLVASAKNISLVEALEYPTIKSFNAELDRKERSAKAQLGTSSSGSSNYGKPVDKMSDDEHKAAWEKAASKVR